LLNQPLTPALKSPFFVRPCVAALTCAVSADELADDALVPAAVCEAAAALAELAAAAAASSASSFAIEALFAAVLADVAKLPASVALVVATEAELAAALAEPAAAVLSVTSSQVMYSICWTAPAGETVL